MQHVRLVVAKTKELDMIKRSCSNKVSSMEVIEGRRVLSAATLFSGGVERSEDRRVPAR